jgi:hypothetical protein
MGVTLQREIRMSAYRRTTITNNNRARRAQRGAHELTVMEATLMKPVGLIGTGVLLLLLGAVPPTYAQQEQHQQEVKPTKQEQQAKPEKQQQQRVQQQQVKPEKQQQQQQRAQQQKQDQNRQQQQRAHTERVQQKATPEHQREQRGAWQQYRAQRNWQSEHRTWQQRGGYNGYRIPDRYFHSYYGRNHRFRIYSLPFMVVGGFPRFQYGGYWFVPVDPWPEFWAEDWYETDDVYVDYVNDGYYLYNPRYPGPGIAINISF